jgi:hypothetical protein
MKVTLNLTPEEAGVLFSENSRWRIRKYVWDGSSFEGEIHEYGPSTGGIVATFHAGPSGYPGDEKIVAALYNAFRRKLEEPGA